MIDKDKILKMLNLQNDLNCKTIGEDWMAENIQWSRAIWTETAELMDELDWKWWKSSTTSLENIHMELVDIWHFLLSAAISRYAFDVETLTNVINNEMKETLNLYKYDGDSCKAVEMFLIVTLNDNAIHFSRFKAILDLFELDFDQLYSLYIGKNVLNTFRQDHGYKDGTYIKQWYPEMNDNQAMYEACINKNDRDLYEELKLWYPGAEHNDN